jgi:hypothetical protein
MENLEKEKRIRKETNRLNKLFKNVSKNEKELIKELVKRASFLLILAEDMEEDIKHKDQVTQVIENASQRFIKADPIYKEYRDTVKNYQSVIKQLTDLAKDYKVPEEEKDPLLDFNNELH